MTGPRFDNGSGFAARAAPGRFVAWLFLIPGGLFGIGVLMSETIEDAIYLLPAAVVLLGIGGGIMWSANGLAANDNTPIIPRDPNRVVKTNHDNTDTDGRGQDFYANITESEIQICETTRQEMYAAEMRQWEDLQNEQ